MVNRMGSSVLESIPDPSNTVQPWLLMQREWLRQLPSPRTPTVQARGLLLGLAIALCMGLQAATAAPAVPALQARVNDRASVLSVAEQERIEQKLADYEVQTSHQIAVLTIVSLGGEDISDFSLRVAKAWALGRRGYDNGILITVVTGDRQIRIELGRGMEAYISNELTKCIIDLKISPAFRQGRYAKGLEDGMSLLLTAARHYRIDAQPAR